MPCATASIKKPIHNVKEGANPPYRPEPDFVSSSLEYGCAVIGRTPSVAAKLRLMAHFAALAGLVARRRLAWLIRSTAAWWSLSGSNR